MFIPKLDPNERPLDNIALDGGFTAIFRKVAVVGDSLASGEFEMPGRMGRDMFEYSWGQFIARMCNSTVYNFSKGGMTAEWYCKGFAEENGFWNPEYASQAYIIALGANEMFQKKPLGLIDDIDFNDHNNNAQTFAGYYGRIIQRLKKIQPSAKFFFVTMPREGLPNDEFKKAHADILYAMSERFENSYVIDLFKYAPIYDDDFKRDYFLSGHMDPMGYLLTAKMIASYIDYIIRHNMNDFKEVGFIGTDLDSLKLDR